MFHTSGGDEGYEDIKQAEQADERKECYFTYEDE